MANKDTIETVEKQHNHPISMILILRAKSKLGFVYGTCKNSDYRADLEYQWEKCNAFVLFWILNSISKELMSGIVYATDAAVVWSDLKEIFDKVDGSRGYQLHTEICTIAQGNTSSNKPSYHNNFHNGSASLVFKLKGHTKETCYRVVGYPHGHPKFRKKYGGTRMANVVDCDDPFSPFSTAVRSQGVHDIHLMEQQYSQRNNMDIYSNCSAKKRSLNTQ
ncbi:hypothetical protein KY289_008506 [Solanum tuberosum]|nr:hypothetical protein KY289_008506 [Solanum tuberosum]